MEIVEKKCCSPKTLRSTELEAGKVYRMVSGSVMGNTGELMLSVAATGNVLRYNIRLRDGAIFKPTQMGRFVEVKAKVCIED